MMQARNVPRTMPLSCTANDVSNKQSIRSRSGDELIEMNCKLSLAPSTSFLKNMPKMNPCGSDFHSHRRRHIFQTVSA